MRVSLCLILSNCSVFIRVAQELNIAHPDTDTREHTSVCLPVHFICIRVSGNLNT